MTTQNPPTKGPPRSERSLLLGEWACLGLLYGRSSHGFALAELLRPGAEVGRVWSLSRPLTYRAIDVLVERGLVAAVGVEAGRAGPDRTVLRATPHGRAELRSWLDSPVEALRDLRTALLLKLTIAQRCGVDVGDMLVAQRAIVEAHNERLAELIVGPDGSLDPVALWRHEASEAGLRFLDQLLRSPPALDRRG